MMPRPLKYPIGVQSFEKLRREGYVYVDKTSYIPRLLENSYYFLSRPRRFGKSLLLSTLEAYFRGKRDLFEGLAVGEWEKAWVEHPVVHLDFNTFPETDLVLFMARLRTALMDIAASYGVREELREALGDLAGDAGYMFERLIYLLYRKTGRGVVILIDEYDRGLLESLHDEKRHEQVCGKLRPFFSALKTCDPYIRFAFLTGVSRFANTTLFSGVNNLLDISLSGEYASLLGISHSELELYFGDAVEELARAYGWTKEDACSVLKGRYDGYRFTRREELLYNPFSLLNALKSKELGDYWVQTGSSLSLARHLRRADFRLDDLTDRWVNQNQLGSIYSSEDVTSLLFQTGYLTISDFNGRSAYKLTIPNQEVQSALTEIVLPEFVRNAAPKLLDDLRNDLGRALLKGDVDKMMQSLRAILSEIPYHEIDAGNLEKHYHLCLYLIFMLMGADARCERAVSGGRLDMVVQTPLRVYLFEFKLDGTPEEALRQIDERGYAIPWEARGREVVKIGVVFSSTLRTISAWKAVRE